MQLSAVDKLSLSLFTLILGALLRRFLIGSRSTPLKGPPRVSWLSGVLGLGFTIAGRAAVIKEWSAEYGPVFQIPWIMGRNQVVLCDPKAVAHFYARDSIVYGGSKMSRKLIENLLGRGLIWAEKDDHRRQRRALAPGFTNAAIRSLSTIFYNSAYKVKSAWDAVIASSSDGIALINVEEWMNRVALDSVGIAGFSHDFGTLDGKECIVADAFNSLVEEHPSVNPWAMALGNTFPFLLNLAGSRFKKFTAMRYVLADVASDLIERVRREEHEIEHVAGDKSIIGLLIKSGRDDASAKMTHAEVASQMNVLLLAGYETTSISMTWALIELCRNPQIQEKLRKELLDKFPDSDPDWDQINSAETLPYLDAVVHETLRFYPAVTDTIRVANQDDIVPLSKPIITASGQTTDTVFIAKGTSATVPIATINKMESFWGPDAETYRPERWLDPDALINAKEMKSYRHILTFSDGPRTCLGKGFAVAEFKSVFATLIKNFTFELIDGPKTEIDIVFGLLRRPRIKGEKEAVVTMKVRKLAH